MSGIYNETYFRNHPEEASKDGVLYLLVLVHKRTNKRECVKIGIAAGKNWKSVNKRASGYGPYTNRTLRTYTSTLYNVWKLEQALHQEFLEHKFIPKEKFGGYTECFNYDSWKEICLSIPA